jgi:hypothetical protein
MRKSLLTLGVTVLAVGLAAPLTADELIAPISQRYADAGIQEVPSFQKHVVPLFGRLGCNGRACHGSFQGRGGFRLSLFGYDFKADHEALFDKDSPRVDTAKPLESLIIAKPTDADMHEGGERYKKDSWQYHVLRRWIEGGAKFDVDDVKKLNTLEVTPSEIAFSKAGETVQLKAIAVWADGSREDVTPLCRFQTNDDQVAKIDQEALVTAAKAGDTHLVISYDKAVITVPVLQPVSDLVADKYPATPTPTKIDELIVAKLRKLGVVQSDLCTDAEFLRRVSLDITGTLPTADEVRGFLADTSPDKRKKKIDELLETPAYAAWWTTKLCDFTGNNEEKLNNVTLVRGRVVQNWWDWINKRVADNVPYDQLAAGIILGKSREEGEDYLTYCKTLSDIDRSVTDDRTFAERKTMPYYWSRTNVNLPEEKAISFAYAFMGARIECAQCHKHPFDQWSKDDFDQFKKFFTAISGRPTAPEAAEAREESKKLEKELGLANIPNGDRYRLADTLVKEGKTIPFGEVFVRKPNQGNQGKGGANKKGKNPRAVPSVTARLLGGAEFDLTKLDDPRQPIMDWLRDKNNPYFARAFANRVWAAYFNVGIVNPTDDMNLANPPSNKPLLDYLTEGFIASGFDMKWLHREVANSRAYQLSWLSNETNKLDERNFSHAIPRRLPAEVAVDAVYAATIADERAATMRTDLANRAIIIPGASARYNANRGQFALGVFGRSTRESNCDCDRSMEASLLQTVYLQNDTEVSSKLEARDSWVTQSTLKLAKAKEASAKEGGDKSPNQEKLVAEMKAIERKLERLRKQKNEEQASRLEKQLAQLRKELTAQEKKASEANDAQEKGAKDPAVVQSLVENAYLRSLSRFPNADELTVATNYITAAEDVKGGLTDVLWALVNTKEFIVNH